MPAQWPLVYAQLLTVLPTLDGWERVKMFDGPPVDDNVTGLYCTVGYEEMQQVPGAGSFLISLAEDGVRYAEAGDIRCALVRQWQRNDLKTAREEVFAVFNSLTDFIRDDRRFGGVLSPDSTLTLIPEAFQQQTPSGPFATLPFSVAYSTVT